MDTAEQKEQIKRQIDRARDGMGEHIDELDRRLRTQLDVKSFASEHAPQLIAGGAVVGLLVGFGMPGLFKTAIKIGVPLALVGFAVKKVRESRDGDGTSYAEI